MKHVKKIHNLDYFGVELEVEGYYYPNILGDWYNPPSPEQFEIEAVTVGGVDITDLIDNHLLEIEERILNQIYS